MKYIITDQGEVRTGGAYHHDMLNGCKGRVIAAGHYEVENGNVRVFGSSIGFRISAKPQDAEVLKQHLKNK